MSENNPTPTAGHPDEMTKCPECQARFLHPVVADVPDRPDLRSFACPACGYVYANWPDRENPTTEEPA